MFELSEEETLMTSSDNSVKLTSHRIIHESGQGRQQIMLEDYDSYQLKKDSIGAYGIFFLIFILITLWLTYEKIVNYIKYRSIFGKNLFDHFWNDTGFIILLVVLIIFHFFYLISRRYTIKINGKYNSIEFRVKSLGNSSVKKMLTKMVEQSNKRKNLQ